MRGSGTSGAPLLSGGSASNENQQAPAISMIARSDRETPKLKAERGEALQKNPKRALIQEPHKNIPMMGCETYMQALCVEPRY